MTGVRTQARSSPNAIRPCATPVDFLPGADASCAAPDSPIPRSDALCPASGDPLRSSNASCPSSFDAFPSTDVAIWPGENVTRAGENADRARDRAERTRGTSHPSRGKRRRTRGSSARTRGSSRPSRGPIARSRGIEHLDHRTGPCGPHRDKIRQQVGRNARKFSNPYYQSATGGPYHPLSHWHKASPRGKPYSRPPVAVLTKEKRQWHDSP